MLDELAARQGIAAPASVEQLLGGWPEDERDDGFEEAVRRWREEKNGRRIDR